MNHVNKISTQNLICEIEKKLIKVFTTRKIIQSTNDKSIHSATMLWRPLKANELKTYDECFNKHKIKAYTNLMESLSLLLNDKTL